jgi:hypothetical protein
MWIVVYTTRNEDELHYVGPFLTKWEAALWETIFLKEHPYNYITSVAALETPKPKELHRDI